MNIRRGLIGLFFLTFLLATAGMITLTLEDKKDLSSQASIGVQSLKKQTALDDVTYISNTSVWDGSTVGLSYQVTYDNNVWQSPARKDNVFVHQKNNSTVRFGTLIDLTSESIKSILSSDFVLIQSNSAVDSNLTGWKITKSVYKFFDKEKYVDLWTNETTKMAALAVMSDQDTQKSVEKLISGISPITSIKNVKGASTDQDESARIAALARPSVSMIITTYCAKAKFISINGSSLSEKAYPYCIAASGTGFFVNPDGYIATNGHVVKFDPTEALYEGVVNGQLENLLVDYIYDVAIQYGETYTREEIVKKVESEMTSTESVLQFASIVLEMKDKSYLSVTDEKYHYYTQLGTTPFTINTNLEANLGQDILEGKLIDYDYKQYDNKTGFASSDIALLKIDGNNYPALPLGNFEDITVGSSLQVIGFPGIANGNDSLLLDTSANSEPTITRGVVSALKKAKGDQKNLIQTDASINHGNSGGPAINSNGQVIGIATYGLTPEDGGGNYNFLRDVTDLKSLMTKNKVTAATGTTYDAWKTGLENYWHSYFKYADSNFTKVKESYPVHPTVSSYLAQSQNKKGTTEDLTPMFTREQRKLYTTVSEIVMVLSFLAVVALFIIDRSLAGKQKKLAYVGVAKNVSPQPIQPTQTIQTPQNISVSQAPSPAPIQQPVAPLISAPSAPVFQAPPATPAIPTTPPANSTPKMDTFK